LAIVLFILIAAYSIIGTVLPQGLAREFYIENYSMGNMIVAFQFDSVYSSIIFVVLMGLFMINLIGCTLKILPGQLNKMKDSYFPQPKLDGENLYSKDMNWDSFKNILEKKRFKVISTEEGYKASKHRIGNLGSSVTHLGIIIIVLGSFLGGIFTEEGFFNMFPGDVKSFPDYGFVLKLDDFYLDFKENGSVDQYNSVVSVTLRGKEPYEETLWVNNPLKVNKLSFYQTSYGWASKLVIKDENEELIETKLLRNGESYFYQGEHLSIYLYGFFPNMTLTGAGEPVTMSEQKNNPHYAVMLYEFGQHVGNFILEPGQPIDYGNSNIYFEDSTLYTGLTYRKDFGYIFVLIGSLLLTLGLVLSFYFYPKFIDIKGDSIVSITRQNTWGFNYQIKRLVENSSQREE